jgi:hypothetical protein
MMHGQRNLKKDEGWFCLKWQAGRIGTNGKHVTFPDAVKVGACSDIATVTLTGSDCTGVNISEFVLREDEY